MEEARSRQRQHLTSSTSNPAPPSIFLNSRRAPSIMADALGGISSNDTTINADLNSPMPTVLDMEVARTPTSDNHHVDEKKEIDEKCQTLYGGDQSEYNTDQLPKKNEMIQSMPIDETPYEHGFEPGDHVIRWDMLPILWPIQIHGIVLDVSEDRTTVTICDFGITAAKSDEKNIASTKSKSIQKIVSEENDKLNEAMKDDDLNEATETTSFVQPNGAEVSDREKESAAKGAGLKTEKDATKKQRLNVITLTKWSDLRKWHKVNYNGAIIGSSGVGKGLKSLGEKTEKLWSSISKPFVKSESFAPPDDVDVENDGEESFEAVDEFEERKKNRAYLVKSSLFDQWAKENGEAAVKSRSSNKTDNIKSKESTDESSSAPSGDSLHSSYSDNIDLPSELVSVKKNCSVRQDNSDDIDVTEQTEEENPTKELDEPKTLAQMIADANEIEKRSRKTIIKGTINQSERRTTREQKAPWHSSLMKSLSSIFPQGDDKDNLEKTGLKEGQLKSSTRENENADKMTIPKQPPNTPENLPKSDPTKLVLARTRFLLDQGEGILPPYHIINSNSECIAVWCKTGRWSTLQAAVFLHSTAIGNAKSTTALTLGVAAAQPLLIPVMAGVGIAAVGTPWLMLKLANDKWNDATLNLTDKFWMQAEPEVFVECIEQWSRLKQRQT